MPPGRPGDALGRRHLLWIPGAAALGFLSAFVFADVWRLPPAGYHLAYLGLVGTFFAVYTIRTGLPVVEVARRRLPLALSLGVLGGLALTLRVLADPSGSGPSGLLFAWDLLWRGVIYGAVDGALLSAFPWLVTWRAFGGESASLAKRLLCSLVALGAALAVTSAYHLGYPDFRGPKLAQANLGNAIASLPTLLSANPLASPLAHAILHLAAVTHDPQSDLFLPPHDRSGAVEAETVAPATEGPVLEFPLRGEWRVFQPPGHPREALDFVAVDTTRRRYVSRSWVVYLLGAGPVTDWYGWSRPVHAPFEGTVVAASDGEPDRETVNLLHDLVRPVLFPPRIAGEDIRPFAGNHVIIQSGPVAALLAHLRRQSVRVAVGQHVTPGDVIGEVGNSRKSLAPHLHLQLMDSPDPRQARLLAFRFRRYARWNGTSWETVWDRAPAGGERIRSVSKIPAALATADLTKPGQGEQRSRVRDRARPRRSR